jgi:hypothetical protein
MAADDAYAIIVRHATAEETAFQAASEHERPADQQQRQPA